MPDISYSVSVNVNAGALSSNLIASNVTSDFATTGFLALTLNLGTATQAISTASASSLGLTFARALHTTGATISLGRLDGTTLYETARFKSGDAALLRLAPGNYGAKCSSADGARLLLQILEE